MLGSLVYCTCDPRLACICENGRIDQDAPVLVDLYNPLMSLVTYNSPALNGLKLGAKNAPPPPTPRLFHTVGAAKRVRSSSRSAIRGIRGRRTGRRASRETDIPSLRARTLASTCVHSTRAERRRTPSQQIRNVHPSPPPNTKTGPDVYSWPVKR